MKTILILGAGIEQTIAIKLAKEIGLKVIAVDGNPDAPGLKIADVGINADIKDVEAMVEIGKKYKIDGVMTHAVEIPQVVAKVAKALNLPSLDLEVAERATNKLKRIKCLVEHGVPCPKFETAKTMEEAEENAKKIGFPCVFKPIDNAGARGVSLVRSEDEIERSYKEAIFFSKFDLVLIEEYLEGYELSTEAFVIGDEIYHTSFDDRNYEDKGKYFPYFIEDGGDLPTELPEHEINKVKMIIEKSIKALGINFGAAKGDIVIDKDGSKILEMAARTSGGFFCSVQTPIHNGIQILKPLISISVGDKVDRNDLRPKYNKPSIERYIMSKSGMIKSITGIEEAAKVPGVLFFKIFEQYKRNSLIPETFANITKIGVIIGTGETKEIAIKNTEKAVSMIKVEIVGDTHV